MEYGYPYEDFGYYLADLLNSTSSKHSNLRRQNLIYGEFCNYTTASTGPTTTHSIKRYYEPEIESYIFSRLSPHFSNLESLKLISCFEKFPNRNITIDMPYTALETLALSDADYGDELDYINRETNPKSNAIVLMAISIVPLILKQQDTISVLTL